MSERPGLGTRAMHMCAPLLAGAVIDTVDFATLGPVGLTVGWLAGGVVGWWLAPILGFSTRLRPLAAILAGVYCALPMTGFVPIATFAAGLARVIEGPPNDTAISRESQTSAGDVAEAEFESRWEDDPPR